MINSILGMYKPKFAETIVYMLQATEYQIWPYLRWLWRVADFNKVAYRKTLVKTSRAKTLLAFAIIGMACQMIAAIAWGVWSIRNGDPRGIFALDLFISTPLVWAHFVIIPLLMGRLLVVNPYSKLLITYSAKIFANHPGLKIAVAGSYGKTTMKEILLTVLSEGKKVAATPANKNVAISHAAFAKSLEGDEDILVIEYGEGAPGDVAKFCRTTKPDIGIITGLAPAHLDKYKTLEAAGKDIFYLADFLGDKNVYINEESGALKPFIKKSHQLYSSVKAAGWEIEEIKISIAGTSFNRKKDGTSLRLRSSLLGKHQVGPLAVVAAIAHDQGLTDKQLAEGIRKIKSFEHRMQPRESGGAWIIDDTYNGNIEGMLAGLKLLEELPAKRKIYVTPGLVDQGRQSSRIHKTLGKAIARANPNLVILMQHSVTDDIITGINSGGFKGQLVLEEDPLNFYSNLDRFVAAGDLVMMQNDWPDNYV